MERNLDKSNGMTLLLGIIGLLAFSPTVIDLGEHWIAHPWPRYSLIFLPLLIWTIRTHRHDIDCRVRPWLGASLIAVALLIQLISVTISHIQLARPALGMACVGLLLMRGLTSPRCALLALWIIPIPHEVTARLGGDPATESLFKFGALLLAPWGLVYEVSRHWVMAGTSRFHLDSVYLGLPLLVHLLGLGWYACTRWHTTFKRTLYALLLLALGAPVIQFLGILLALLAVHTGQPGLGASILETGCWALTAMIVVYRVEFRSRTRSI